MPSLASYIAQGTTVTTLTGIASFFLYTKHCTVNEPLDPTTEPLFNSRFFRKYNPHNNHVSSDAITCRIPLTHLRPDLLEDTRNGGSKLVETFCGNIWSGWQYTPQRLIHSRGAPESSQPPPDPSEQNLMGDSPVLNEVATKSKSTWSRLTSAFSSSTPFPTTTSPSPPSGTNRTTPSEPPRDLWSPSLLATSTYPPGTTITNHFLVLSHTPTAILVRCGGSPLDHPHSPRSSDGLFEISAVTNFEKGYAEFKLKSLFYNGTEEAKGVVGGMSPTMWWLHQQYAKLWLQRAVSGCRMGRFRSQEKQRRRWEEEKEERAAAAAAAEAVGKGKQ